MFQFVNRPNLQFTLREFTRTVSNGRLALAFAIVVGLFALTGPFGTYDALDLPGRLGYWLITLATTWTIALLTISIFGAFRGQADHGNLILILTGSLLACVPITLAVELIGLAYFGR
ncbi:MAG: hypothetical protein K0U66_10250, partial [Gammaproteobacteria bacterium]|nr:hypothetical protein [Gammaproteobacteria bacterium]